MKISMCETIIDEHLFIESHELVINNNEIRPKLKQPYIERLKRFKDLKNEDNNSNNR